MGASNNIFCFYGSEDFLIEEEVSLLKEKIKGSSGSRPDSMYFSPENTAPADIAGNLCTSSLFGGARIAVLEGFDDEEYLGILGHKNNFPDSLTLVIKTVKLDKRGKLYKLLSSEATVKEFNRFAEWETKKIVDWIMSKAKTYGKTISVSSAGLLNDISGPSLRQLSCEIEKLSVYAADRGSIEAEDIKALSVSGELGAFALENAFADRDLKSAIRSLDSAFKAKQSAHVLIGRLASRLRPYLMIKALQAKKVNTARAISILGMNPYFYERCSKGAALYSLNELVSAVEILSKTDIAVKNSASSPRLAMELAIVEIMGGV